MEFLIVICAVFGALWMRNKGRSWILGAFLGSTIVGLGIIYVILHAKTGVPKKQKSNSRINELSDNVNALTNDHTKITESISSHKEIMEFGTDEKKAFEATLKDKLNRVSFWLIISLVIFVALILSNFNDSDIENPPTGLENLANLILILLAVFLGIRYRNLLKTPKSLVPRIVILPKFLQKILRISISITLVAMLFAVASMPAGAIRGAVDPDSKIRQAQFVKAKQAIRDKAQAIRDKAQAIRDKAIADKAAVEQAIVDKKAADKVAVEQAIVDKKAADKKAADKAAVEQAIVDKKAADKAAVEQAIEDKERQANAGFTKRELSNFRIIRSNIVTYILYVQNGRNADASRQCDTLDSNYSDGLRGVYSKSSIAGIETVLDNAKDAMYSGVVDCTRGFRKSRIDLIGESINEFTIASKYLDGLLMVAKIKG